MKILVTLITAALLALPGQAALVAATGLSAEAATARTPLFAIGPDGGPLPHISVRVGDEVRQALAPSGRDLLALRPAQVAAGGRVFVYAAVPGNSGMLEYDTEALVWLAEGGWKRRDIMTKRAGRLGHVSSTVLVPEVEGEIVPAAVFRRADARRSIVRTLPALVQQRSLLRFSFAVDEWDFDNLAPVTVSVTASIDATGQNVELFRETVSPADLEKTGSAWLDKEVDLTQVAGMSARFEFRATVRETAGKLRPHVAWGVPAIVGGAAPRPRPNIVVVSLDGVRARSLGCCGGTRPASNFLDELFANEGTVFDYAVTQSVETVPSHMTLMTSLYPSVHGVGSPKVALSSDVTTLAERLSGSGYTTAGFTDGALLGSETGFGRGFSTYREFGGIDPWQVEPTTSDVTEAAVGWLSRHRDEASFLFVHLGAARAPYIPPADTLALFKDDRLEQESELDEGALVRYEREIKHLDDAMRDFVAKLDRVSPPDRTLLVVTSGHGAEFLEHGALESGTQLYDESIRVPLMMRGAGVKAGTRHTAPIGLVDLMPTILDVAGASAPKGMQGESIAKSLRSGIPYSLPPRFSEAHAARRLGPKGKTSASSQYAVVSGTRKLIMKTKKGGDPSYQAFDLAEDPGEGSDLMADGGSPAWYDELKDVLANFPTACERVARAPRSDGPVPVISRLAYEVDLAR